MAWLGAPKDWLRTTSVSAAGRRQRQAMEDGDAWTLESYRTCWCGCGEAIAGSGFFVRGHDRVAEAAVIDTEYGGVPELLEQHGYGPGGRIPPQELEHWRDRGGRFR